MNQNSYNDCNYSYKNSIYYHSLFCHGDVTQVSGHINRAEYKAAVRHEKPGVALLTGSISQSVPVKANTVASIVTGICQVMIFL